MLNVFFRVLFLFVVLSALSSKSWAEPPACAGRLANLEKTFGENSSVALSDIPEFQRRILDQFESEFGYRPQFKEGPTPGILYLLAPKDVEMAEMGRTLSGDGQCLSFGVTEIFLPKHREKGLSELLFSETLKKSPSVRFIHTSFSARSTNRKVYDEKIREGHSPRVAVAQTPSGKRLARFGFILGPDKEQDFEDCSFSYMRK